MDKIISEVQYYLENRRFTTTIEEDKYIFTLIYKTQGNRQLIINNQIMQSPPEDHKLLIVFEFKGEIDNAIIYGFQFIADNKIGDVYYIYDIKDFLETLKQLNLNF